MPGKKPKKFNQSGLTSGLDELFETPDRKNGTGRYASTVPSTPLLNMSALLTDKHKQPDLGSGREFALARIKSLGKIDLKSPILPRGLLLSPSDPADDVRSLATIRTNRSLGLRLLNLAHKSRNQKNYYDDFTTIDWAKAFVQTNKFNYAVKCGVTIDQGRHSDPNEDTPETFLYTSRYYYVLGKWFLTVAVSFSFALIAYFIDKIEILLVGAKYGYCRPNWFASQVSCCADIPTAETCHAWVSWSSFFSETPFAGFIRADYLIYIVLTVVFATCACLITLTTRIPSRLPSIDENALYPRSSRTTDTWNVDPPSDEAQEGPEMKKTDIGAQTPTPPRTMYTAAGSGVPEVKTILSGFVIRRFLGSYTLCAKTIALILAIASGMALGKEGPYVHLATCVGNIMSRFFPYINENDLMKKQILSASASSGVALAFGSPLGGVLFILEEINHYLPATQLFLIFICAMTSTLFLKFLNPYGTGKTVLFELNFDSDWKTREIPFFIFLGISGGIFGASFVKFTKWWPKHYRLLKFFNIPVVDVLTISVVTGLVTFWNPYTKQASSELILDLATSCSSELDSSLCPTDPEQFQTEIKRLFVAFVIKLALTFVTFGLKLPSGIYVPSMVAGALFGRIFAMILQVAQKSILLREPTPFLYVFGAYSTSTIDLGIYSMIGAGAFMAGVTRMNITLVTILFELTSSYTYVLPFSISIAVANWFGGLLEENSLYESLLISNDYPFMSPEHDITDPLVSAGDIISSADTREDISHRRSKSDQKSISAVTETNVNENQQCLNMESHGHTSEGQFDKVLSDKLYLDITESPFVPYKHLEAKLFLLAQRSMLDGCIAIIKDSTCVGTLYFAELEFCMDRLKELFLDLDLSCSLGDIYCQVYDKLDYASEAWKIHAELNLKLFMAALEQSILGPTGNPGTRTEYFNYGSNDEYLIFENQKLEYLAQFETFTNFTQYVDTSPICINHDVSLALAQLIFDRIGTRAIVLQKRGAFYGVLHKKVFVDHCRRLIH